MQLRLYIVGAPGTHHIPECAIRDECDVMVPREGHRTKLVLCCFLAQHSSCIREGIEDALEAALEGQFDGAES